MSLFVRLKLVSFLRRIPRPKILLPILGAVFLIGVGAVYFFYPPKQLVKSSTATKAKISETVEKVILYLTADLCHPLLINGKTILDLKTNEFGERYLKNTTSKPVLFCSDKYNFHLSIPSKWSIEEDILPETYFDPSDWETSWYATFYLTDGSRGENPNPIASVHIGRVPHYDLWDPFRPKGWASKYTKTERITVGDQSALRVFAYRPEDRTSCDEEGCLSARYLGVTHFTHASLPFYITFGGWPGDGLTQILDEEKALIGGFSFTDKATAYGCEEKIGESAPAAPKGWKHYCREDLNFEFSRPGSWVVKDASKKFGVPTVSFSLGSSKPDPEDSLVGYIHIGKPPKVTKIEGVGDMVPESLGQEGIFRDSFPESGDGLQYKAFYQDQDYTFRFKFSGPNRPFLRSSVIKVLESFRFLDQDRWLTYINEDYGFSLDYPESWKIKTLESDGKPAIFFVSRHGDVSFDGNNFYQDGPVFAVFPEGVFGEDFGEVKDTRERGWFWFEGNKAYYKSFVSVFDLPDLNNFSIVQVPNAGTLMAEDAPIFQRFSGSFKFTGQGLKSDDIELSSFSDPDIGVSFDYPSSWGEVSIEEKDGSTGKAFRGTFSEFESAQYNPVVFGGATRDYTRETSFYGPATIFESPGYEKYGLGFKLSGIDEWERYFMPTETRSTLGGEKFMFLSGREVADLLINFACGDIGCGAGPHDLAVIAKSGGDYYGNFVFYLSGPTASEFQGFLKLLESLDF